MGGDGAVHHGFCDVALLRTLPQAAIMAAIDEPSLRAALEFMRGYDAGLSSVRYPRDVVLDRFTHDACPPFALGKARCLTPRFDVQRAGGATPDVAVLAFGTVAHQAAEAMDLLAGEANVGLWDARFAKPVDRDLLRELLTRRVPVVTVEDHSVVAGFGAAVLEAAAELGLDASRVVRLGLPDAWVMHGSRSGQLAEVGLDGPGIARSIRELLARGPGVGAGAGTAAKAVASSDLMPTR